MRTTQLILWALLLMFVWTACQPVQKEQPERIAHNVQFDEYLSGFTEGEISKRSPITVLFQEEIGPKEQEELAKNPFSFEPAIEGKAIWKSSQALEFIPAVALESGQIYTASLSMSAFLENLPQELSVFQFQFKVKDQFVNVRPMASIISQKNSKKWVQQRGRLELNDLEEVETIERVLTAYNGNKSLDIDWVHEDATHHQFTIHQLPQKEKAYPITWKWKGEAIDATQDGALTITVPAKDNFKHLNTYRYEGSKQQIVLEFSDVLDASQNLEGLVQLGGKSIDCSIENNLIKIFTDKKLRGDKTLKISEAIVNEAGEVLIEPLTETLTFSDIKPQVRWIGKGNIIPNSERMPIVFESVNINAVDVRVIKIREQNVKQFFQVNDITGSQELKRVGDVVLEKKIALDKMAGLNLTDWTKHSLDLANLIQPEPGAIYEIALGFKHSYSLYVCQEQTADQQNREEKNMLALDANWDSPSYGNSYWDYYEDDYDYDDLKDPCSRYYYRKQLVAKRNILASDLGLVVKRGDNGMLVAVTNIETTEPLKNVELDFYDYHQRKIASAKTDKEGLARPELPKKPFFLIAKQGKQRGYLRLDDGNALSMSRFDVAGLTYHKGLKGFIYGERGVWRPGDELFLNFILEDKDKTLPANHPVVFTLKDAKGAIVVKKTSTQAVGGMYNFTCQTDEDAPTGNYLATVRVGGASFSKTLKIESIKPNRLKINLDFGQKELSSEEKEIKGTLKSTWLHGAIAKNLKAKVNVTLREGYTKFDQYSDFNFQDPVRNFEVDDQVIFEGELNEEGLANITTALNVEDLSPGQLKATFLTKVFEPGGDFSVNQVSLPYHPYTVYVGVRLPKGDAKRNMLLTDKKHRVEIRTVDKDGKPVDVKDLTVKLYKISWKWWFDKSKDDLANYRGRVSGDEKETGTVSTVNGKAFWEMEVKYPEWGRYLVRVSNGKEGHSSGQVFYIDWPGWAGKSKERDPEGATALNFTADAERYKVGEEVSLTIPTGDAGRALVTIENGSKVLEAHWVEAKKGNTIFKFKATAAMTPNAYATVTLLQPHAQTKNDLPIRMYGAIPITVEDPTTKLEPQIALAESVRPGESFEIGVSEQKGGPMAYTVAIVDEGLLDLTGYKTPAPWSNFYRREALGVKTWDFYDHVLGAFGGDIKSLLSIGGDAAMSGKGKKKPDRFKPVVLYAGPFYLKAGETAKHKFTMPNYVGSVRAMVIASHEGAYGDAEKTMKVRQPLMVLGSLPRVLGVEENFKLPVTVFAMEDKVKDVTVNIETSGGLTLKGGSTQKLTFSQPGDDLAYFEVSTGKRVGTGNVKITVTSGQEKATYETDVAIRNANQRETMVAEQVLSATKDWTTTYKPVGMLGTNNGVLEVSSVPPLNLGKRLRYLIRYPYGCVEQTTSSVFPQLYLSSLLELSDKKKAATTANIKAGIKRLYRFQTADGGLGYWQGGQSDEWGTNYAGHFWLEAKRLGYSVNNDIFNNWISYQTKAAQRWTKSDKASSILTQAYRLYLLALANKPDLGAMNRLRVQQIEEKAMAARWYLAAAYYLSGQKGVANDLAKKATRVVKRYEKNEGVTTFGSALRDQALIVQALSIMNKRDEAGELVKAISDRLKSQDWLNTQETGQALVAMAKYAGDMGRNHPLVFEYKVGSGSWQKVNQKKAVWQLDLEGEQASKVSFRTQDKGILFARLVADGIPAVGQETATENGLKMEITYLDLKDQAINPASLAQGTDFKAVVKITNTGNRNYHELALHHVFPSGWEIHNSRLTGAANGSSAAEYVDVRDDRVYTFFDLKKTKTKTFIVNLNASYLGRYYLPGVGVAAMYDQSIQARQIGRWVTVQKQEAK
ncbi:MAG: alpha-2-macroglobulin family protein [Aureispira sp.]